MKEKKPKPENRRISREELLRLEREKDWKAAERWPKADQRAIFALQHYQDEPLAKSLQEMERKMGIGPAGASRYTQLRVRLALAATFLLVLTAGYFLFQQYQAGPRLFSQHFEHLPSAIKGVERTTAGNSASLLASALRSYENGSYKEAEGLFRAYLAEEPEDGQASFYYGLLQLGKGNAGPAVPILKEVVQTPPGPGYQRAARWYLALAYLDLSSEAEARPQLEKLAKGNDRYARKAKDVLKALP